MVTFENPLLATVRSRLEHLRQPLQLPMSFMGSKLSKLQVATAQRIRVCHEEFVIPRRGYLLALSTGVGKTRTILAAILDAYCRDRSADWRALILVPQGALGFLSEYEELRKGTDLPEDLLQCATSGKELLQALAATEVKQKCIVTAYSLMCKPDTVKVLREWLRPDSFLVMDECHCMANSSSLTHKIITREVLDLHPHARCIFSSATPGDTPAGLQYLRRLLPAEDLRLSNISRRHEVVPILMLHMKHMGCISSVSLDFSALDVDLRCIDLTGEQKRVFAVIKQLSQFMPNRGSIASIDDQFLNACKMANLGPGLVERVRGPERRSLLLTISNLSQWTTAERDTELAEYLARNQRMPPCAPSQLWFTIRRSVRLHLYAHPPKVLTQNLATLDSDAIVLGMPPSAIESVYELFDRPDEVAELSSRTTHWPRGSQQQLRFSRKRNLANFMTDQSHVCVMSRASSGGVSLHASFPNSRRRLMVFLNIPTSPATLVQQFGRTHRTNQHHTPSYLLAASRYETAKVLKLVRKLRIQRALGDPNHAGVVGFKNLTSLEDASPAAFRWAICDWILSDGIEESFLPTSDLTVSMSTADDAVQTLMQEQRRVGLLNGRQAVCSASELSDEIAEVACLWESFGSNDGSKLWINRVGLDESSIRTALRRTLELKLPDLSACLLSPEISRNCLVDAINPDSSGPSRLRRITPLLAVARRLPDPRMALWTHARRHMSFHMHARLHLLPLDIQLAMRTVAVLGRRPECARTLGTVPDAVLHHIGSFLFGWSASDTASMRRVMIHAKRRLIADLLNSRDTDCLQQRCIDFVSELDPDDQDCFMRQVESVSRSIGGSLSTKNAKNAAAAAAVYVEVPTEKKTDGVYVVPEVDPHPRTTWTDVTRIKANLSKTTVTGFFTGGRGKGRCPGMFSCNADNLTATVFLPDSATARIWKLSTLRHKMAASEEKKTTEKSAKLAWDKRIRALRLGQKEKFQPFELLDHDTFTHMMTDQKRRYDLKTIQLRMYIGSPVHTTTGVFKCQ